MPQKNAENTKTKMKKTTEVKRAGFTDKPPELRRVASGLEVVRKEEASKSKGKSKEQEQGESK